MMREAKKKFLVFLDFRVLFSNRIFQSYFFQTAYFMTTFLGIIFPGKIVQALDAEKNSLFYSCT